MNGLSYLIWFDLSILHSDRYRNKDNVYMEYMLVTYDGEEPIMSYSRMFKTPTPKFAADRAANLTDNFKARNHPKPRPTKSQMLDFMCSYKRVHLVDGEFKDTKMHEDVELLLMTALSQFAFKGSALALMTTSMSFEFYKMVKDPDEIHRPIVYKEKLDSYRIGPSKRRPLHKMTS